MKIRMLRLGTAVFIALIALVFLGNFVSLAAPAEPSAIVKSSSLGQESGILARRAISIPFSINSPSITASPGNDGRESTIAARRTITPSFGINSPSVTASPSNDGRESTIAARRVITPTFSINSSLALVEKAADPFA